jgi:hypothetical protein
MTLSPSAFAVWVLSLCAKGLYRGLTSVIDTKAATGYDGFGDAPSRKRLP